ncbi:MAG: hypothetical protein A3J79_14195 [Elusimicrobia bacterium RIFOXYB2_FULL_62_6]|nr:MAG: hypothetical protein A3J79_14195 [Elusimicrobia bacterium RIFOXYB2_FULL_62_6]
MLNFITILFLIGSPAASAAPAKHSAPAKVQAPAPAAEVCISTTALKEKILAEKTVRGIHVTCWGAGSKKDRAELIAKIKNSVVNAVVIAIKETDGKVYIPGIAKAEKYGSYNAAIPAPEKMLADFREAGVYTIARVVAFKDKVVPLRNKDLAVRTPDGGLWRSSNGATWVDPYDRDVWDYVLDVAERAAKLGFDEIQFDYIRYPSEGRTSLCRYSKPHNRQNAIANLKDFLQYARQRLKPYNVKISADVFGLTTTVKDDMGIGQDITSMAKYVDYIYPMMYPSHYNSGEYNLKHPNNEPFKVIDRGLRDAIKRLGDDYAKLRPFLQDFNLGRKGDRQYGPQDVRAQIMAAKKNLLESWVLWNPGNKYNWAALTPQSYRAFVDPEYGAEPSPAKK